MTRPRRIYRFLLRNAWSLSVDLMMALEDRWHSECMRELAMQPDPEPKGVDSLHDDCDPRSWN